MESAAARAEQELATGLQRKQTLDELRREIEVLIAQIGAVTQGRKKDSDDSAAVGDFDTEQARAILQRLDAMLRDYDAAVGSFLGESETILNCPALLPELKRLKKAIDDYDYDLAQQLAGDMMQKLD